MRDVKLRASNSSANSPMKVVLTLCATMGAAIKHSVDNAYGIIIMKALSLGAKGNERSFQKDPLNRMKELISRASLSNETQHYIDILSRCHYLRPIAFTIKDESYVYNIFRDMSTFMIVLRGEEHIGVNNQSPTSEVGTFSTDAIAKCLHLRQNPFLGHISWSLTVVLIQ